MEGSEYLLTCAQVAVALAGFSALVVAVRQRDGEELPPQYRGLIGNLIERSLVAIFLSLLPVLLSGLGLSPPLVWLLASGALAGYALSLAWRNAVLRRREPLHRELAGTPTFFILYLLGLLVLVLQIAHALGLGFQQNVWWYLIGLTWLLMSIAYLFYFAIRGWTRGA